MNEENSKTIKNNSTQGFASHPENINKNGRPKKGQTLTDLMREILEEPASSGSEKTRKELLVRKVLDEAFGGNEAMIKLAWNYIDGMPKQTTELSNPDGEGLTFTIRDYRGNKPTTETE